MPELFTACALTESYTLGTRDYRTASCSRSCAVLLCVCNRQLLLLQGTFAPTAVTQCCDGLIPNRALQQQLLPSLIRLCRALTYLQECYKQSHQQTNLTYCILQSCKSSTGLESLKRGNTVTPQGLTTAFITHHYTCIIIHY